MMRPSTKADIVAASATLVHIVVGLLLMAGGGWVVAYQLQHPPHSDKIIIGGGCIVVLGALLMPTIFPVFKQIVVLVFPNGIPVIGGKRASDPPKDAP
jgi:hypothetical protein